MTTGASEGVTPFDGAVATVDAMRAAFGDAIGLTSQAAGQLVVFLAADHAHDVLAWLQSDAAQRFDYLTDITAVEYRDAERPLEVVYQLRSLARRVDLRVKIALDPDGPLSVASVTDIWKGAEWLEREVWDMFGVTFRGHGDLRRILMWEGYSEGHPLRKSFPLRGHRSRAEQTRQALAANPEAHYSMEELSIAEAYQELPADMRARLAARERGETA